MAGAELVLIVGKRIISRRRRWGLLLTLLLLLRLAVGLVVVRVAVMFGHFGRQVGHVLGLGPALRVLDVRGGRGGRGRGAVLAAGERCRACGGQRGRRGGRVEAGVYIYGL